MPRPKHFERRYNLRATDAELELWRDTAAREGIRDLSTWFRRLAAREVERQRRRDKSA